MKNLSRKKRNNKNAKSSKKKSLNADELMFSAVSLKVNAYFSIFWLI
jgi:hypothetical protein